MVANDMDLSLLPYRCPRCDKNANFSTLDGLREHLATKHSYSGSNTRSVRKKSSGRLSPLTQSFIRQRELLEQQLRDAQAQETRHRLKYGKTTTSRSNSMTRDVNGEEGTINQEARDSINLDKPRPRLRFEESEDGPFWSTPIGDNMRPNVSKYSRSRSPDAPALQRFNISEIKPEAGQSQPLFQNVNGGQTRYGSAIPVDGPSPNPINGKMDQDVSKPLSVKDLNLSVSGLEIDIDHDKQSHSPSGVLMSKALTQARDHIDSLKKSADTVVQKQSDLINTLRAELKTKDGRLENVKGQLEILRSERRKLLGKVSHLHRDNDKQAEKMATLTEQVWGKDKMIKDKEREVYELSTFLDEAAREEGTAKAQLELYISGLTERAERAEETLRQLKYTETSQIPQPHTHATLILQPPRSPRKESLREKSDVPKEYGAKVNLSSASVSQYATPPLSPLKIATPPETPPTSRNAPKTALPSPMVTPPASSGRSATSGYYSVSTQANISPASKADSTLNNDSTPVSPTPYNLSYVNPQTFVSPLSPGEIIVENLDWPVKNRDEESGQSSGEEGVEPMLSDRKCTLSGHSSSSTLLLHVDNMNCNMTPAVMKNDSMTSHPAAYDISHSVNALFLLGPDGRLEVLSLVFGYLDTPTLCRMSLVCREWRDVSRKPELWRRVCLIGAFVTSQFLFTLSQWCTQVQSLTLKGLSGRPQRKTEDEESYKRSLRGSLEAGLESLLSVGCETLLSLSIVDCSKILTDRSLWLASCHCRHLERVAYISDLDPVGSEVIWALGAGCRNVQTLIIPPKYPNAHPSRFTDRTLQKVAACWPRLAVLCMGGREITVKGLSMLAKSCCSLQVLELDHMCELTEEDAVVMCRYGYQALTTLEFSFTPVTPKALLHIVSTLLKLRCVRIRLSISDYFHNISSPDHQRQYRDVMSKLKLVQSRPGISAAIHITDYSQDIY